MHPPVEPPGEPRPGAGLAGKGGITKSDLLRQALALLLAARDGRKRNRHLGLVADPRKLDTEIVGLL